MARNRKRLAFALEDGRQRRIGIADTEVRNLPTIGKQIMGKV
jgi:hypothetical protein